LKNIHFNFGNGGNSGAYEYVGSLGTFLLGRRESRCFILNNIPERQL